MGTSRPNWGRSPSWTRFRVICKALLGKQARRRTIGWWAESDDWSAAHGWLARGNDPWDHVQRDAGAHSGGRHRRPDRRRLVPDDAPTLTQRRLVRWLRRADPRANAKGPGRQRRLMKRTEAAIATTAPEITIDAASDMAPSAIIAIPMTPPTAGDIRNTPTSPEKTVAPRSGERERPQPDRERARAAQTSPCHP